MKKIFLYLEPMILGDDNKISLRRVLSLAFAIDLIRNISYAVFKFQAGKSYSDVAMLLGIEAGLIAALLSLTTYSNLMTSKSTTNAN